MDFVARAFNQSIQKLAEKQKDSIWGDVKKVLPAVAVMTPVTFAKNFVEEGMQAGIENSLTKARPWIASKLHSSGVSGAKRKLLGKLESMLTDPKVPGALNQRFARQLGRGAAAMTTGAATAILQMALINRLLKN